jgi:hypothetical protein
MNRRFLVAVATVLVSLATAAAPPAVGRTLSGPAAQAVGRTLSGPAKPARAGWTPPRTPWGDPDLQGIWPGTAMMGVPMERPRQFGERRFLTDEEFVAREAQATRQGQADTEEFAAPRASAAPAGNTGGPGHWGERGLPQRQTSLVVDPPDGRMPAMTAEGLQRTAAIPASLYYDNNGGGIFNGPQDLSVYDRCITRGVVGSMMPVGYNAGNQIVQAPGYVALRNEMIHETRIIPLDGHGHVSPAIRGYMGDSRGHWEGNTLVVDTTNFNGRTGVGANGRAIYHSDALHLTERFTRVDADTIQYEVTIDDSKMWTRPWTMAFPLKQDAGYGMFEYACHEGNYGLRNILSGARAGDRVKGESK